MSSVPTNIAEGSGRNSNKEFAQFLNIAAGSATEVNYILELSKDLQYIDSDIYKELEEKIVEIGKMLNALQSKVRSNKS